MIRNPIPSSAPSRFRLRRRTDADMDALAELWAASWREAMPGIDFAARTGLAAQPFAGAGGRRRRNRLRF